MKLYRKKYHTNIEVDDLMSHFHNLKSCYRSKSRVLFS